MEAMVTNPHKNETLFKIKTISSKFIFESKKPINKKEKETNSTIFNITNILQTKKN
jgi:hypothetical protein